MIIMAMTAFELLGILQLDKSQFDSELKSAESEASNFGKSLQGAVAKGTFMGNVAKDVVHASAQAIATGARSLVNFGRESVSAATSYESAFTGVRKTVDATEEEYQQLSNWILNASTKLASSQEEIAGTMEIAGQLGVSGVDGLQKFTETMIMLGDTTNLNAEEAAGALARFGNIAGIGAEDMGKIGSTIVALGNNFATTESDIVNMSTRLASAGTVAGLSATDILALSTAMSSVGIQAEAGGTAMAQTLAKMSKAVDNGVGMLNSPYEDLDKDGQKAVDSLHAFADVAGMSAEQFAETWKGSPIDAVQAFIAGLHNINESDESVIMTLEDLGLKGIRQTNMLQALALASDMLGNSVNMANQAFEDDIALQNEAALRYGTTESQAEQTANSFKNLKIAIGEELQPAYGTLMSFASGAMQAMTEGFQEGGMEGLMASLGTAISDGLNLVFEKLPDVVNLGVTLISTLAQGIADNADQIADAAVQIVDLLFTALIDNLPNLMKFVNEMLIKLVTWLSENAGDIISAAYTLITTLAQGLTDALPVLIPALVQMLISIVDALTNPESVEQIIQAAIDLVLALVDGILTALPILLQALPDLIQNVIDVLTSPEIISALINAVISIVESLLYALPEIITLLVRAIPQIITSLIAALLNPGVTAALIDACIHLVSAIVESLPGIIVALIMAVPEIIVAFVKALTNPKMIQMIIEGAIALVVGLVKALPMIILSLIQAIPRIISAIIDAFSSLGGQLEDVFKNALDLIKNVFTIDNFKKWGSDLIDGFIGGIRDKFDDVKEVAKGVAEKVSSFLHFSEPDEGPLSNFHTFAPDMMDLFIKGVKDNTRKLQTQVSESFDFGRFSAPAFDASASVADRSTGRDDRIIGLLEKLLDQKQGQDVNVVLEGDANRLFRVIRQENRREIALTGRGI